MSDLMLIGALRMPLDCWPSNLENFAFMAQQQRFCVQAADKIEELEAKVKELEVYEEFVNEKLFSFAASNEYVTGEHIQGMIGTLSARAQAAMQEAS